MCECTRTCMRVRAIVCVCVCVCVRACMCVCVRVSLSNFVIYFRLDSRPLESEKNLQKRSLAIQIRQHMKSRDILNRSDNIGCFVIP